MKIMKKRLGMFISIIIFLLSILSGCSSNSTELVEVAKRLTEIRYTAKNKEELQEKFGQYLKRIDTELFKKEFDVENPDVYNTKFSFPEAESVKYDYLDTFLTKEGDITHILIIGDVSFYSQEFAEEPIYWNKVVLRYDFSDGKVISFKDY